MAKASQPLATGASTRSVLVYSVVLLIAASLYRFAAFPFPKDINGLGPKVEYYRQLFLHLTGLSPDWDIPALNAAYFKHFEATGQKLPDVSNRSTAYFLEPLFELHPFSDADWEKKLSERVSQGLPTVVRKLQYYESSTFFKAKEWNIDYVRKYIFPPGTKIPVFTDTLNDKSVVMQEFGDYVDGLKNKSRKWYARCLDDKNFVLRSGHDSKRLAQLMHKEREQRFTRSLNDGMDYCFFVGSNQVSTRMHSDTTTSAFLMIEGRKRWILFPPTESAYVIPFGHELNVAYNSRVDMFAPKEVLLKEYPFLSLAKGFEVVIEPGDVLFFSSFHWHAVQNLDELTVGVDSGVVDPIHSFTRNTPLTLGTYLNLKVLGKVLKGFIEGSRGVKQVFFQGYNLDESEAAKIKSAHGVVEA